MILVVAEYDKRQDTTVRFVIEVEEQYLIPFKKELNKLEKEYDGLSEEEQQHTDIMNWLEEKLDSNEELQEKLHYGLCYWDCCLIRSY